MAGQAWKTSGYLGLSAWAVAKDELAVARLFKEPTQVVAAMAEDMAPMLITDPDEWAKLVAEEPYAVLQFQNVCEQEYRRRGGRVRANRREISIAVYRLAVKWVELAVAVAEAGAQNPAGTRKARNASRQWPSG